MPIFPYFKDFIFWIIFIYPLNFMYFWVFKFELFKFNLKQALNLKNYFSFI